MSAIRELRTQVRRLPAELDAVVSMMEILGTTDPKEAVAQLRQLVREKDRLEKTVASLRGKEAAGNVDLSELARQLAAAAESAHAEAAARRLTALKLKKAQLTELGKQLQLDLRGTAKEMLSTLTDWLRTGEKPPTTEEIVASYASRAKPLFEDLLAQGNAQRLKDLVADADKQLDAKLFKDFARSWDVLPKGAKHKRVTVCCPSSIVKHHSVHKRA